MSNLKFLKLNKKKYSSSENKENRNREGGLDTRSYLACVQAHLWVSHANGEEQSDQTGSSVQFSRVLQLRK